MNESQFTSNVHKRVTKNVHCWKIRDDFNNKKVDAFYRYKCGLGSPTWIEYKYIKKLPKRGTTVIKPDLTAGQREFLNDANRAGESGLVIIGYKSQGVILKPHEFDGITTEQFTQRLMTYNDLAFQIEKVVSMREAA